LLSHLAVSTCWCQKQLGPFLQRFCAEFGATTVACPNAFSVINIFCRPKPWAKAAQALATFGVGVDLYCALLSF
jgi:hypothetical protein